MATFKELTGVSLGRGEGPGVVYALGYEAGLDKGWRRAMDIVERSVARSSSPSSQRALTAWMQALVHGLKIGYRYYKDAPVPEEVPVGHCSCDCGHQDAATVVILTAFNQMEERLMTTIDELEATLGTQLTELTKDVQRALDVITSGTLSPAQEQAATELRSKLDALDAAVEQVSPETTPEPTPTPEPGTPPAA